MTRGELKEYIEQKYNVEGEYDRKGYKDALVFGEDGGVFAVAEEADPQRMDYQTKVPGKIDVLELRAEPQEIKTLLKEKGYRPAYHEDPENWITLILSEVSEQQIKALLHKSFDLAQQ